MRPGEDRAARVGGEVRAYVTVGGDNAVMVHRTGKEAKLLALVYLSGVARSAD